MEYAIFYSYLKWKKTKKGGKNNFLKTLSKINIKERTLIATIVLSGIIASSLLKNDQPIYCFIALSIEFLSTTAMWFTMDKEIVEKSRNDLDNLDKKYNDLLIFLNNNNIDKKNQIKQLRNELKEIVEKEKEEEFRRKHEIEKWFQWLLMPTVLALVSYSLNIPDGDIDEKFVFILLLYLLVIITYMAIIGTLHLFNKIFSMHTNEMRNFISSLQGVLDRKFPIDNNDLL